ncbi:hypothetical protein [Bradyrhizobium genosp. A]|uniref:hypothetical protein n=1 Tax=Bradyrhizobium genosp. A TaxID=83626 RepID=UPI003CEE2441
MTLLTPGSTGTILKALNGPGSCEMTGFDVQFVSTFYVSTFYVATGRMGETRGMMMAKMIFAIATDVSSAL